MIVRNSRIYNWCTWANEDLPNYSNTVVAIDGTNVSFATGTFKILKSSNQQQNWNAVIGQMVNLLANVNASNTNVYSGDAGNGIVAGLREDATYLYIDTTLPYATLPSWAGGQAVIFRTSEITFENCSGLEQPRIASEARKLGKNTREFYRYRFLGSYARNGYWWIHLGVLRSLTVNVRNNPGAITGYFQIEQMTAANSTTLADNGIMHFQFNVATPGRRVITQTGATGMQTGDTMTLNAVAMTQLPTNIIWTSQSNWYTSYATTSPFYQMPTIEIEIEMDMGQIAFTTTSMFDEGSMNSAIAAVIGNLP